MGNIRFWLMAAALLLAVACSGPDTPLPRAYPRIALPDREYRAFEMDYPFGMEYPQYTEFLPDTRETAEPYWGDIHYPGFEGRIHLSYKTIQDSDQLQAYLEDTRSFVHRHIPKATAINEQIFINEPQDVYGMVYQIRGREAASPLQFFATDSLNHFLRGALYFDVRPNNDSLAPVIQFIEEDVRHLLETLEWN